MHEMGLSSNGKYLAIALDRTIQIYDLEAGEDSWPVSAYISASGHYIAGLQFEHNDSLLRVQLSNKGTVVYLGRPTDSVQGLQHWQGKGGLKHAFLDSSRAKLVPLSSTGVSETLAGLQLLRQVENGWLFAAQKRCTTSGSASYCVGFIGTSSVDRHAVTAERLAIVLVELPSSISALPVPQLVHGSWQDLPSAHVQHPQFSLSADNGLLAMSENVCAKVHAGQFSRVFVFRLPTIQRMLSTLESVRALVLSEPKPDIEMCAVTDLETYNIHRLPLNVGCAEGKIMNFGFESIESSGTRSQYQLSAVTEAGTKTWTLLDS